MIPTFYKIIFQATKAFVLIEVSVYCLIYKENSVDRNSNKQSLKNRTACCRFERIQLFIDIKSNFFDAICSAQTNLFLSFNWFRNKSFGWKNSIFPQGISDFVSRKMSFLWNRVKITDFRWQMFLYELKSCLTIETRSCVFRSVFRIRNLFFAHRHEQVDVGAIPTYLDRISPTQFFYFCSPAVYALCFNCLLEMFILPIDILKAVYFDKGLSFFKTALDSACGGIL